MGRLDSQLGLNSNRESGRAQRFGLQTRMNTIRPRHGHEEGTQHPICYHRCWSHRWQTIMDLIQNPEARPLIQGGGGQEEPANWTHCALSEGDRKPLDSLLRWANPGLILGQSWADPGSILGRFWTDPGPIADPGPILDRLVDRTCCR